MEMVWVRQPKTDIPRCTSASIGTGRVVYFPWDIDRTFWEVLCVDHGTAAAQRGAGGRRTRNSRLRVDGPGVLDVTVWRQKDR